MSNLNPPVSGGVELTDELIERLAAEAERGYDLEQLRPRSRHGRQTDYLFLLLGPLGFVVPDEMPPMVAATDGYVVNRDLGIWVHADGDMIRLVVEPDRNRADRPGYRLVLGRGSLRPRQALDIIAVHTRAAVAERS